MEIRRTHTMSAKGQAMNEKLCIFCRHFCFDDIGTEPDYSEYTGGSGYGGMSCAQKHYSEERPYDTDDFRNILLTADKCKDYDEVKP